MPAAATRVVELEQDTSVAGKLEREPVLLSEELSAHRTKIRDVQQRQPCRSPLQHILSHEERREYRCVARYRNSCPNGRTREIYQ